MQKPYPVQAILEADGVPTCSCDGVIKPDVVLYEEPLNNSVVNGAVELIRNADVLIVGGTSLSVYPAAGFLDYYRGNKLVVINKSETFADEAACMVIKQPIGDVFKQMNF